MDGAPAGLKPPANGQARSGPLSPQRSRGERDGERGFTSGPSAVTDFLIAPPLPSPLPHFVAERESETAVGGFPTSVLPPLQGSARRLQGNGSSPHPLLITPGCARFR